MYRELDIINGAQLYESASMRAFWQEIIAQLRGRSSQLLSFEDVRNRLRLHEESYHGLQNIPLDAIIGSVGRHKDFTNTFLPKPAVNRDRWTRIFAEMVGEIGLPPIEVYRVCDVYFVRDGNHRVSVARAMRFDTIQAYVTNVEIPVCLTALMATRDMDAAEAYMTFLDETRLRYTRPRHEALLLTETARYADLLTHLEAHRDALACECDLPDMETTAAHWYDHVYLPIIDLVRQHGILENTKGRTEADLYMWMVDHLKEQALPYTGEVHNFNLALAAFLRKRRLPVPDELAATSFHPVPC